METIGRLGGTDLIRISASCADTYNRTKQHPHCGRCSQCVDRRFAALASGLARSDPAEAYAPDLMEGVRTDARDREIALSYVRNAAFYETATPSDMIRLFPTVLQGLDQLGEPPDTTLQRIGDLLARHGCAVTSVVQEAQRSRPPQEWPDGSLPRLFGDVQRSGLSGLASISALPAQTRSPVRLLLVFDRVRKSLTIQDVVEVKGSAAYGLLLVLAEQHLQAVGEGSAPEEYPFVMAKALAGRLDLSGDEALRKRLFRTRTDLRRKFDSAGFDPELASDLIENSPWHGYRLRPELVDVRVRQPG